MKPLALVAAFAAFFVASSAFSQTIPSFAIAQCEVDAITFSSVRLPQAVLANGKPLGAGLYEVRITTEHPAAAVGQSPNAECWVEFMKSGVVAGREVASVISSEDIGSVAKEPEPKPNATRVDVLKGGEYLRVWMNGVGTHYIVNLPIVR
jgi:hypothetical protein